MSTVHALDTVRIRSGDYEGRVGVALVVRDDGTVIVDLLPVPMQPDIFWGELAVFEEGLEIVDDESETTP